MDVLNYYYFKNTLDHKYPTLSHNVLIYYTLNLSLADPRQSFRARKQKRETQNVNHWRPILQATIE